MKRFTLNKIKIAALENLHVIRGRGTDKNPTSADLLECISDTCEPSNLQSCLVGLCTNTNGGGHEVTDPIGTEDTTPK